MFNVMCFTEFTRRLRAISEISVIHFFHVRFIHLSLTLLSRTKTILLYSNFFYFSNFLDQSRTMVQISFIAMQITPISIFSLFSYFSPFPPSSSLHSFAARSSHSVDPSVSTRPLARVRTPRYPLWDPRVPYRYPLGSRSSGSLGTQEPPGYPRYRLTNTVLQVTTRRPHHSRTLYTQ